MLALIRKDFIASRIFLMIASGVYFLYALTAHSSNLEFFALNIAVAFVLAVIPILIDEKYRIEGLVSYLPVSRRTIVRERYLVTLFALLVGLCLQYGCGGLLSLLTDSTGFRALCSPQAILIFCAIPVVGLGLYLPCCFRFGPGRGALAFSILMTFLIVSLGTILRTTGAPGAIGEFTVTSEMRQQPELLIPAFVDHISHSMGPTTFYVGTAIGSAALILTSIALSTAFLERRGD